MQLQLATDFLFTFLCLGIVFDRRLGIPGFLTLTVLPLVFGGPALFLTLWLHRLFILLLLVSLSILLVVNGNHLGDQRQGLVIRKEQKQPFSAPKNNNVFSL